MSTFSRGFTGRRRDGGDPSRVPPGQYVTEDFPVLTAGPTPNIHEGEWSFTVVSSDGETQKWSWDEFMDLPSEEVTVDIHCVTKWTKLDTTWRGVSVDTLLEEAEGDFALVRSFGGYTTNLDVEDLIDGKAWVAYEFEGDPLDAAHGGPARLLVPHLYFWKSAKWVQGIVLGDSDTPGFWEQYGYHNHGDPWREERYEGD